MKTITKRSYYDLIMAAVEDGTLPSVDLEAKDFMGDPQPICFYRHPDNVTKRCVAELLIPDESYTKNMEQKNAAVVWDSYADKVIHVDGLSPNDMREVQLIHDRQFRVYSKVAGSWNKEKFLADLKAFPAFREFA